MGDLVQLQKPNPGNGASEALERYFKEVGIYTDLGWDQFSRQDHLLAWLWTEGFKVVPFEPKDELKK